MAFNITYKSKPLYDSFGTADYWGCSEWIKWYDELERQYGQAKAEDIWANAWLDGLSVSGGGRGIAKGSGYVFDSVPLDCRSFNVRFINFLDAHPYLNDVVRQGLQGLVSRAISTGTEVTSGVVGGITATAKVFRYVLPLVFLAGIIGFGYYGYKKYLKA